MTISCFTYTEFRWSTNLKFSWFQVSSFSTSNGYLVMLPLWGHAILLQKGYLQNKKKTIGSIYSLKCVLVVGVRYQWRLFMKRRFHGSQTKLMFIILDHCHSLSRKTEWPCFFLFLWILHSLFLIILILTSFSRKYLKIIIYLQGPTENHPRVI